MDKIRVAMMGSTCTGKTTIAKAIASTHEDIQGAIYITTMDIPIKVVRKALYVRRGGSLVSPMNEGVVRNS